MTGAHEAEIAKARVEMIDAVCAASPDACAHALVDLLVLLRGVVITHQGSGLAHATAREVAESAVTATLEWLKG